MGTFLQKLGTAAYKVGSTINTAGRLLGNKAPELRVSETLQKVGSYLNPVKTVSAGYDPYYGTQSKPTNVLGATTMQSTQGYANRTVPTNPITGGGTSGTGAGASNFGTAQNTVNDQMDQGLDFIEEDYNNVLGQLGNQESSLRGQADIANQTIGNEASAVQTQLGQEQGVKEQGIQSQLNTAETGAKSSMQQARDLFRQTQQSNIAQLSALGISSSSVAEALAERLGVETARRIAGVSGSLQEVRQNASQELARTKDYYQRRITDIKSQVETQKAQIQNTLLSGLNQINSSRQQAATDKSRSRAELINNAQQAIQGLAAQQQQFEQSLKEWATKKSAALTPIITDPQLVASYQKAIATQNAQPGITQQYFGNYGFTPQGEYGYYPGKIGSVAKKQNPAEDEL